MGSSNGLSVWKLYFWRKSKHITIPDQSYYNLPEKKLWRISNWTIVTLFCCVLQQTWRQFGPGVWCLFINISGHGQCGRKRKKPSRFCVIKREYSNKLYELGCSPIKPTRITKTIIWPTSGPLMLKSRKKDYKECICLWAVSDFLIAITGSKSAILLSSWPIYKIQNANGRKLWSVNRNGDKDI